MHDIAIKKAYVVLGKFKESHQKQCKKHQYGTLKFKELLDTPKASHL